MLVLDDLHVADEPSLLLLRFIARELGDDRLLVVCALRDVDPTMRPPVAAARAELVREPWVSQISLTGFAEAEVAEYIGLSAPLADPHRLAHAIHARTEGNPFFVAALMNLLGAEGHIADDDAWLRVPPGLRAVINERVGRLSQRCRSLLVPAAVMGRSSESASSPGSHSFRSTSCWTPWTRRCPRAWWRKSQARRADCVSLTR